MRTIATLLVSAFLFGHINDGSFAAACSPNDIVATSGTDLYISDLVITQGDVSSCPSEVLPTVDPFLLDVGKTIQFWYRLQGSGNYARSKDAAAPFKFRFFRKSGNDFVFWDTITLKAPSRRKAFVESQNNSNRFDWRVWVRKERFQRPGDYSLGLYQNDELVCFDEKGPEETKICTIEFKVQ